MIYRLLLVVGILLTSCAAADPAGVVIWPKGVPPGGLKEKAQFENHAISISHREQNGLAEVHEKKADVIVVQSGEATLVLGGEVINPKPAGAGEVHGTGIKGGVKKSVSVGDVIHIPARIPHQFFVAPGKQITYLVVKVVTP
jgi:mannose-6-phosphate isomerase-like protein (cupin superfamily)